MLSTVQYERQKTEENNHSFAYKYKDYHTKYFICNLTRYGRVDLI